ncbi:indolepyruvate oxidoreductase subunit beta family protein [Hwanghaeella sp.]|uniref:indolepyruvate oxidoreductase subunit beta family protein n=1 Tax=Hwanghaeella sp. TaxID=2605943 RepID=UPI003CCC0EE9
MTEQAILTPKVPDPRLDGIIKLAIMAVGGQGGGVLTGWIEALARGQGYACQATSVAGVAQRTGATIYYIEMAPKDEAAPDNKAPIFSLAPAAGDVDILIAAEMMEAGRAIMRGFVTPDRTTLIASTHRALAVSEKTVPGDGIASAAEVRAAAETAATRFIQGDMEKLARENGSVISASLFGALARAGVLPFSRQAFEDAIRASGKGVEASLRAFGAGYDAVATKEPVDAASQTRESQLADPSGPSDLLARWNALQARVDAMPAPVAEYARLGLRKVVDFQDLDYGDEYIGRVEPILADDHADRDWLFSREAAKYIANAMAYDDVIRVADLKTRSARFARIHGEMKAEQNKLLHLTEFMHPRAEEIVGMLPAGLGRRLSASAGWMRLIDRCFNRGRRVRTDRLAGFLILYFLGGRRNWRRRTLRHAEEQSHLEHWLGKCRANLQTDYDLAVELLRCRRLIKGYSDTHARGHSKFDRVLQGADLVAGRQDAADWVRRLREAALADEKGEALDGALATIRSFT